MGRNAVVGVLFAYAVLVATNLGEFWPFSIYPMFSQAGNPWSRAVVSEVDGVEAFSWEATTLDRLAGRPFATKPNGVDPIDLANFVSKTEIWSPGRLAALRTMFFGDDRPDRSIVVYRVLGQLENDNRVVVEAIPYALISPDSTQLNTSLRTR